MILDLQFIALDGTVLVAFEANARQTKTLVELSGDKEDEHSDDDLGQY